MFDWCLMLSSACWHSQILICRWSGLAFMNSKSVRLKTRRLLKLLIIEEPTCQTDMCLQSSLSDFGYHVTARPYSRCLISWYLFWVSMYPGHFILQRFFSLHSIYMSCNFRGAFVSGLYVYSTVGYNCKFELWVE